MPKLVFHDSEAVDRTVDLGSDPVLIGRATDCQVQTQDAMVSRRHARITWDGGYWIEDLGSANGVFVGNERVQRAQIRPGDQVRCGSLTLRFVPDVGRSAPRGATPAAAGPSAPPPSLAPPAAPPPASLAPPPAAPPPAYGAAAPAAGRRSAVPVAPAAMAPPPAAPPPAARRSPPPAAPSLTPPSTPAAPARRAAREPSVDGSADLQQERARRQQAESAVLSAEQRAATAEGKLQDAQAQLEELEGRVAPLEEEARAATERAQQLEQSAREGERWRRQVDQLRADLRRLRGGAAEEPVVEASPAALAEITLERDRLRQRVSDLEAEVTRVRSEGSQGKAVAPSPPNGAAPANDAETGLLRRKVEQLTSELRRLRGGQAPAASADDERIAALEARLARAEQERDEARQGAEQQSSGPSDATLAENEKLRRMIDQLTAENRRLRQGSTGAPPAAAPVDDPRVADLTARLERAERERDAAKRAGTGSGAGAPAQVGESAAAVDDALADLRASLRAAKDEVGVLSVEAPSDSVSVLKDALEAATEQVERAREKMRDLKKGARLA